MLDTCLPTDGELNLTLEVTAAHHLTLPPGDLGRASTPSEAQITNTALRSSGAAPAPTPPMEKGLSNRGGLSSGRNECAIGRGQEEVSRA